MEDTRNPLERQEEDDDLETVFFELVARLVALPKNRAALFLCRGRGGLGLLLGRRRHYGSIFWRSRGI
jgi:hypothetical protein